MFHFFFSLSATVMQLVEADIGGLISKILHAVGTARQNKEECYQLARLVLMIQNQLAYLQDPEMMQRSEIQRPLDGLDDTLRQALELVMSCQNRNSVYRLVMARRQVERFRDVQSRIESYLVSHFNSHINITCSPDRSYIDTSVPSTRASSEYESQVNGYTSQASFQFFTWLQMSYPLIYLVHDLEGLFS